MIGQLLINGAASLGGGIIGAIENAAANNAEIKRIEVEADRDKEIARQNQLKDFYITLDRADDPKKVTEKRTNRKGETVEKVNYKHISIPARKQRFYIVLVLACAYALTVLWCGIDADRAILSFPAEPDKYKWLDFWGFTLVEGSKTSIWQLTLGGLILPLLSPVSFTLTKYVTGADWRK